MEHAKEKSRTSPIFLDIRHKLCSRREHNEKNDLHRNRILHGRLIFLHNTASSANQRQPFLTIVTFSSSSKDDLIILAGNAHQSHSSTSRLPSLQRFGEKCIARVLKRRFFEQIVCRVPGEKVWSPSLRVKLSSASLFLQISSLDCRGSELEESHSLQINSERSVMQAIE